MSDWRLQGQEKYLKGVQLYKRRYKEYRANWDHDHCEFCNKKFSTVESGAEREGYTTFDSYHWICTECYEDFHEMFEWKVEDA